MELNGLTCQLYEALVIQQDIFTFQVPVGEGNVGAGLKWVSRYPDRPDGTLTCVQCQHCGSGPQR